MDYTHIPSFDCFYSEAPKPSLLTPEAHFEYEMILVCGGSATLIINHQHYELKEKSLVFISRMDRHSFIVNREPYCRYVASMSSDLIMSNIKDMELLSIFLQRPQNFRHAIDLSDYAYRQLLPLFEEMTREFDCRQTFYQTKSFSCIVSILIELYRSHPDFFPMSGHSAVSGAVLNAQKYIHDHFNRKLTLQEISDQQFMDRHTLSAAFKEMTGITFKDYLIYFRISEAKKLLISTNHSIEQIGDMVGYSNVNNFIRIFKEREALTPLQYRKQYHAADTPS